MSDRDLDDLMCASCDLALKRPDDPGVHYAFCRKCVQSVRETVAELEAKVERLLAYTEKLDNRIKDIENPTEAPHGD